MAHPDPRATALTQARYDRVAPLYDWMELLAERSYQRWRRAFWEDVAHRLPPGGRLLEVGVGTGKNIPFWPTGARITAVDLAPGMLRRAERRAARLQRPAELEYGDVQALSYPEDLFDVAAGTFVFCSVPDPILGLVELARVVRPGGHIFLMEHVRSSWPPGGLLMDALNPVVVRLVGANINRDTVANVRRAGLDLVHVQDLSPGGIFKVIVARVGGGDR